MAWITRPAGKQTDLNEWARGRLAGMHAAQRRDLEAQADLAWADPR
jgi:hypothetical protein